MIINPIIWFAERELDFVPRHFIKCPTPLNFQSKQWVQNKTNGRYAFVPLDRSGMLTTIELCVCFEDQKDATMYELLWAGSST
jgi:hypothetical protein